MRVQMRVELIRLHRDLAGTFIYVTHDQTEAMTMGQRIAVLEGGLLQQVGPPQEVYDRPANLFVAEFIGSPAMNFLRAQPADGGLRTDNGNVRLPDDLSAKVRGSNAKEVIVGFRPEHLTPVAGEDGAYAASFAGTVDLVESLGSEIHVTVSLEHGSLVARLPAHLGVSTGANITLGVTSEHLHLFDGQTRARIGP
jgi:multiple sugar transport system ATP-binding protein